MAQVIKNANIFGRVGTGIGQGLAEQIPKEIENYRLRTGLKNLADQADQGNMTPAQFLAQAAGTYGATPQIVQSFGELAKQQGMAKSLENLNKPTENPYARDFFKENEPKASPQSERNAPSITSGNLVSEAQKGYIPPSTAERDALGAQAFKANPARFNNDPKKALEYVDKEIEIQKERNLERQKLVATQQAIQDNVVNRLKQHSTNLGVQIPDNVYSSIEDKAIQAVKPKDEGGEGLSEQQAIKRFGEEMDQVSRDYKDISPLGGWSLLGNNSESSLRALNSLQKRFRERDDTENFADTLIATQQISPMMGYGIAEKVSDYPELNKSIKALPTLKNINEALGLPINVFPNTYGKEKTLQIAPELMKKMGNNGSPLAVAYELEKKGYDPEEWLKYLDQHQEQWNPTKKQQRQLTKTNPVYRTLNDRWLSSFTGLE